MKRYIVCVLVGMLVAGGVQAERFYGGTQELGVNGFIDFNSTDGTRTVAELQYGMYIMDYVQLGGEVIINRSASEKIYGLGVTSEYDLDFGMPFVPFVGARLDLVNYNTLDDDGAAAVLGGTVGAMFLLSEHMALSADFRGNVATASIYANDDENSSSDLQVRFGFRYFY